MRQDTSSLIHEPGGEVSADVDPLTEEAPSLTVPRLARAKGSNAGSSWRRTRRSSSAAPSSCSRARPFTWATLSARSTRTYEEQRGSHPGQLPVIACTGSEAMKDKYGTNYKPKLEIVKWVDRPAELPDASPVDPADIWQGETPATAKPQAVHVPLPAPKPAADALMETEF